VFHPWPPSFYAALPLPGMNLFFLDTRRFRQALTLLLLTGALACMFPPRQVAVFEWWAAHAAGVALGYLLLGIFFLTIDRPRLMLVCFGCSAAISFYYHESGLSPLLSSLF